jgi:hypothetical protein
MKNKIKNFQEIDLVSSNYFLKTKLNAQMGPISKSTAKSAPTITLIDHTTT